MESIKLSTLKFILRQWAPESEVPFRKNAVIAAIKILPNLAELEDGRKWCDIGEEMEDIEKRRKDAK